MPRHYTGPRFQGGVPLNMYVVARHASPLHGAEISGGVPLNMIKATEAHLLDSGHVVLASLSPDVLANRIAGGLEDVNPPVQGGNEKQ